MGVVHRGGLPIPMVLTGWRAAFFAQFLRDRTQDLLIELIDQTM
jgi:hypothetical protein